MDIQVLLERAKTTALAKTVESVNNNQMAASVIENIDRNMLTDEAISKTVADILETAYKGEKPDWIEYADAGIDLVLFFNQQRDLILAAIEAAKEFEEAEMIPDPAEVDTAKAQITESEPAPEAEPTKPEPEPAPAPESAKPEDGPASAHEPVKPAKQNKQAAGSSAKANLMRPIVHEEKLILAPGVVIDNGAPMEQQFIVPSILGDNARVAPQAPQVSYDPVAVTAPPQMPTIDPAVIFAQQLELQRNQAAQQMLPAIIDKGNVIPRTQPIDPGLAQPIPKAAPVKVEPATPIFDNTEMIKKYPYLQKIQDLNLSLGQQVQILPVPRGPWDNNEAPTDLIGVLCINSDGSVNTLKSATIDTGKMYDGRVKFMAGVCLGLITPEDCYENLPVYELSTAVGIGANRKVNLNMDMLREFFTGGANAITMRPLYNAVFQELNKKVALITIPTKKMNKESRKKVQDLLVKTLKSGIFTEAIAKAPGSRLRFAGYKDPENFYLTNLLVSERYLGIVNPCPPVEVHFESGKEPFILTMDSSAV